MRLNLFNHGLWSTHPRLLAFLRKSGQRIQIFSLSQARRFSKVNWCAVKPHNKVLRLVVIRCSNLKPMNCQKYMGCDKCCWLVYINKRVVLRKAFPQGYRVIDQCRLTPRLGPKQGRFQETELSYSVAATSTLYLIRVNSQNVIDPNIVKTHCANFLWRP